MADWSEIRPPRLAGEVQRARNDVEQMAALVSASTAGTTNRLVAQAGYDAASAWFTECYLEWKRALVLQADRTAPAPNPAP